jgi:membrane associated rhomboid family serine protease
MFLPIGDEPNPRGVPWVNYLLIASNIAIFVLVCFPLSLRAPDLSDPGAISYLRLMATRTGVPPQLLAEQLSAYDLFIFAHGFKPAAPSVQDLLTSMFLHAGWLHLLGNMLFLWIFGDNVELHLGRAGYLGVYLVTGAAATLFFALFQLDSPMPLVGASGAISGVLGCYFVWFPRNRVRVLMVLIWIIDVILVPARWVLGFYLII